VRACLVLETKVPDLRLTQLDGNVTISFRPNPNQSDHPSHKLVARHTHSKSKSISRPLSIKSIYIPLSIKSIHIPLSINHGSTS
jgi:hypothetical protein